MEKKITAILDRSIYPYLYCLGFLIYKTARYFPSFNILTALACLAVSWLFCWGLFLVTRLILQFRYPAIAVLLILLSLLHVATVAKALGYEYAYIPDGFYLIFYLLVLIVIIFMEYGLRRLPVLNFHANKVFNVFVLIECVVFLVHGIYFSPEAKGTPRRFNAAARHIPVGRQKDIVWILMDEYASSNSLRHQFAFENPLDRALRRDQFELLPDIRTRFNATLFSVNAIFNEDDTVSQSSFFSCIPSISQSIWVPQLEASGYRFVNLGVFDIGRYKKMADRSGYPQAYLQQVLSGTILNVINNKLTFNIQSCDQFVKDVVSRLEDSLHQPSEQPRFFWAHISVPHEPFCRDSHGQLQQAASYRESDSATIKRKYVEYLQYGNQLILHILAAHPELAEKIVVISGDHGPRYPFLHDKAYQFWPYAAVHFPVRYDTVKLRRLGYISQLPSFIMHNLSD